MRLSWNEQIWCRFKDIAQWGLGALGAANELFVQPRPRPEALPFIGMLLAWPSARKWDRRRTERAEAEEPE